MEGGPPGWGEAVEEFEDGPVETDEEREDPETAKALGAIEERTKEADLSPRLLQRLQKRVAKDALAVFEGYRRFTTEELSVEPEKMLAVSFEPIIKGLGRLTEAKEEWGLEPDEEKAAEYHAVLSELWRRHSTEWGRLSG